MEGQFSNYSTQASNTAYHPKLLETLEERVFFHDVLNDLDILEKQKAAPAEPKQADIHITVML